MQVADICKLITSAKKLTDEELFHIYVKDKRKLVKRNRFVCDKFGDEDICIVSWQQCGFTDQYTLFYKGKTSVGIDERSSWEIWGKKTYI